VTSSVCSDGRSGEFFSATLGAAKGRARCAAERLSKEAIELQPGHSPALNVLSTFLASRGRLAEAQHYAHSALATWLKPGSAEGSCSASLAGTPRHSTALVGRFAMHTDNGSGKVARIRENHSEMQKLKE